MKYSQYVPQNSGFMKLKEGENKVRFVSEFEEFESEYQGKKSTRYVAYVIDRADGKVKPLTFGAQIAGQLQALATSSEYGFTDLPPYDMLITKSGSGLETEYKVNAARKDTPLTTDESLEVEKQKSISSLAEKLGNKVYRQEEPPIEAYEKDEEPEIEVKDIPF